MRRRGFTLVELLVVLVILAVLAAILLPAVQAAVRRAREAAASSEIRTLSQSLAGFQSRYGAYPPSRVVLSETGDYSVAYLTANLPNTQKGEGLALVGRTLSAFRGIWPRMNVSTAGPPAGVPGGFYDFNGDGKPSGPVVIHGDECLVLFLGGPPVRTSEGWAVLGFAKNVGNPFYPGSQNREPASHQFDAARLVDIEGNGFPSYLDSLGGTTSPVPYAYFSGYGGAGCDPDDVNLVESDGTNVAGAYGLVASPSPNPYTNGVPTGTRPFTWVKGETFQIVCAGTDRLFGPGGAWSSGKTDPLPWDRAASLAVTPLTPPDRSAERDNLTNFAAGRLE